MSFEEVIPYNFCNVRLCEVNPSTRRIPCPSRRKGFSAVNFRHLYTGRLVLAAQALLMITLQKSIETYIRAKDGNRPHLITQAFNADAELTMQINTRHIAFPSAVKGAKAISKVLVSEFALRYENVYTFCVGDKPAGGIAFDCDWLACMSEKGTGFARAGFGRYEWAADEHGRVRTLRIVIEEMMTLPQATAEPILQWAQDLPYPWCPRNRLADGALEIDAMARIRAALT
jgi:hypothetical protein